VVVIYRTAVQEACGVSKKRWCQHMLVGSTVAGKTSEPKYVARIVNLNYYECLKSVNIPIKNADNFNRRASMTVL
jgi:hypothetical protein